LEALGVTIIGATTDTLEQAQDIANNDPGLTYQVAYGVTKEEADSLGSWWSEDRDGYIQPTEFIMGRGGVVLGALYASGPVGRMGADEVVRLITNRERRRQQQETPAT
jgi:peroxiredoxin